MKKICFALMLLLCCGSAFAFDFDPIGTVKKAFGSVTGENAPGITAGFSRDDRLEVVKDDIYRLMWQDGGPINNLLMLQAESMLQKNAWEAKQMTHTQAVEYCENLKFAGYSDWRLPTINELLSITDDSRYNPAINKAFKNVAYETNDKGEKSYGWYWSSTKHTDDSSYAWIVGFGDGYDGWNGVSSRDFVRCVRQY